MAAWIEQSAKGLSPVALQRLLDAALSALWTRTKTTLGEVTLTAIGERVLFTATERFPIFSSLEVEPSRGIAFRGVEEQSLSDDAGLEDGIRFLLVELLTVLGNLTAEILTPELHAELMGVVPPQSVHLVKGLEGVGRSKRHVGEGVE